MTLHGTIFILSLLSVLFSRKAYSHECADNWHLVTLANEPACWALLEVPDFSTDYSGALNLCEAAKSDGVTIRNSAEKAVMAELAIQPALTCYKGFQNSVFGDSKSFDYEKPPKYLEKLNLEETIKLERGIKKGDRITIGFSLKSFNATETSTGIYLLEGGMRIGKSLELKFEINYDKGKNTRNESYSFKHDGLDQFTTIEVKEVVTERHIGVIVFDFLEKRISFLDSQLDIPSNFSYKGNREISIKNLIISSIEHSKICPGHSNYEFGWDEVWKEKPDVSKQKQFNIQRTLEANSTLTIPPSFYDFHDTFFTNQRKGNPLTFDVQIHGSHWNYTRMTFWSNNVEAFQVTLRWKSNSQFQLILLGVDRNGGQKSAINYVANPRGRSSIRLAIASSFDTMIVKPSISSMTEHKDLDKKLVVSYHQIDKISMLSDSARYSEIHVAHAAEVIVSTCNFRAWKIEDANDDVPYKETCEKRRNILCQRAAKDEANSNDNEDGVEKIGNLTEWKLGVKVEVEDLNDMDNEKEKDEKKTVEKQQKEVEVGVEKIEEFQWCVIGLTSGSFVVGILVALLMIL